MIKAIVLTYDDQIGLAELLIKKYCSLGLSECFDFLVPINEPTTSISVSSACITLVQSPRDILGTMNALLNKCKDDEWVFWAIDDRYPISFDRTKVEILLSEIRQGSLSNANGVKLLPWREMLEEEGDLVTAAGNFCKQKPIGMFGFWHHQFLRAGVLRRAFFDYNPNRYNSIREFNRSHQSKKSLPFLDGVYVPVSNLVTFGEPLWDGKLTLNGKKELERNNCVVPDYEVADRSLGFYDVELQLEKDSKFPKKVSLSDLGLE